MVDKQGNQVMELSDMDSIIIMFNLVKELKDKMDKFNHVYKLRRRTNKYSRIENSST